MSSFLRRLYRLLLLLLLAGGGFLIELLVFPLIAVHTRRSIIRRWSRALLAVCGLRLRVHGGQIGPLGGSVGELVVRPVADARIQPRVHSSSGPPHADPTDERAVASAMEQLARGRMLVANHSSWLDIFAVNALTTCAFVATAELRRWPVAGWLVALAGTVFIERARRHAVHQVIQALRERIRGGIPVAVFPEATTSAATTSTGVPLLPFHANLLQAAIAEGAEIIPLAIRYLDATGTPALETAYVGDTTFLQSVWNVLGARGLVASVSVLEAVPTQGRNRHELARELRERVSVGLGLPTQDIAPGTAAGFPAASR